MKKLLIVTLLVAMIATCTACSKEKEDPKNAEESLIETTIPQSEVPETSEAPTERPVVKTSAELFGAPNKMIFQSEGSTRQVAPSDATYGDLLVGVLSACPDMLSTTMSAYMEEDIVLEFIYEELQEKTIVEADGTTTDATFKALAFDNEGNVFLIPENEGEHIISMGILESIEPMIAK